MILESLMTKTARSIGERRDDLHLMHMRGDRFALPQEVREEHPGIAALMEYVKALACILC